jgi:outer membrane receptor for ferrienterochelin and colicin
MKTLLRNILCLLFVLVAYHTDSYCQDNKTSVSLNDSLLDLSLDKLMDIKVVSVSRKTETVREAPSSVYVLTRKRFLKAGARNLVEALRLIPGIQAVNNSDEYLVSIRGVFADNGTKLLIMIDGHEVNRALDQGSSSEVPNMFLDKIERIEVIRGPGGVIYGSSAFSGIINIITQDGAKLNSSKATFFAGSFNQFRSEISSGNKLGDNSSYYLYAGVAKSSGQKSRTSGDEFTNDFQNVHSIERLDDTSGEFYAKLDIEKVNVRIRYFDIGYSIPSRSQNTTWYKSGFFELSSDPIEVAKNLSLVGRTYYDGIELKRNQVYRGGESRFGGESRLIFDNQELGMSSVAGLEYRRDEFGRLPFSGRNTQDVYQSNIGRIPDIRENSTGVSNIGLYVQHDQTLIDWLKVTGGLRYDDRDRSKSWLSPRLGLVANPNSKDTLKLLMQGASLPPQVENLGPGPLKAQNRDLARERIKSIEAIWNHQESYASFELSLWRNSVRDMSVITQNDPTAPSPYTPVTPFFIFRNGADMNVLGTDFSVRAEFDQFDFQIAHSTLIDSNVYDKDLNIIMVTTNGDNINGYSDNYTNLDLNYALLDDIVFNSNLTVDWGRRGVRRRRGVFSEAESIPSHERRRGDWSTGSTGILTWLNATVSARNIFSIAGLESRLIAHNVLNERSASYNNSGYFEQGYLGRAGFLELGYTF